MATIKFAQQGIRQNGFTNDLRKTILKPGDVFIAMSAIGMTEDFAIPSGCIGVVHVTTISVIRDDCKAARKAMRLAEATTEELASIARRKKYRDYKLGCKAELN